MFIYVNVLLVPPNSESSVFSIYTSTSIAPNLSYPCSNYETCEKCQINSDITAKHPQAKRVYMVYTNDQMLQLLSSQFSFT